MLMQDKRGVKESLICKKCECACLWAVFTTSFVSDQIFAISTCNKIVFAFLPVSLAFDRFLGRGNVMSLLTHLRQCSFPDKNVFRNELIGNVLEAYLFAQLSHPQASPPPITLLFEVTKSPTVSLSIAQH